jgi:hypothetical protein
MAAKWITAEDAYWNLERQAFNILIDRQPAGICDAGQRRRRQRP